MLPATRNLRQLHSEITEVISTIHENIDHGRADLLVSLPELRKVMVELMDDSNQQVQLLVTEFGNHSLVREMQQDQVQLEEDAHDADMLIDLYTMDGDQDGVARWGTPSQLHSKAWVSSSSPQGSSSVATRDPFPANTPRKASVVFKMIDMDTPKHVQDNPEMQSGRATKTPAYQAGTETPAPQSRTDTLAYQAGTETPACQNGTKTPAFQAGPVDSLQSEDTKMHQENCTVPRQFLGFFATKLLLHTAVTMADQSPAITPRLPALKKVNDEICPFPHDTANSSPLGPRTETSMNVVVPEAAADVQPPDGTEAAQAQDNTASVQPPEMTPTGTEATCTKATCTTWGINYNSQLVSDTVEPQGVRDIQTYCQTTQAATSGRRHGLHNPGTRNTVNVNHGELLHTEVQLSSMEYGHLYTANPVQPVPHVQLGADSSTTPVQQLPTFAKAAVSTHKGTPSLQQANVLLSPHAPWSYEDKSSPLHARSTALLANHDAVGKPAGHQIKAADTPVWCQTTPVDVVSLEAAAVQPLLDTAAVQPTVVQQPHETELNATNSLGQYDGTTNTSCMCEHAAH